MVRTSFTLRDIGPGLVIAATGLGAGDLVVASVAGAKYGTAILWTALLGAIMKFTMNEGLARWQLATGTTLLEGWIQHLPKFVSIYFFIYLVLWTFVVAAALIAGTGLAAHALYPELSVESWGIAHSLLAAALVLTGSYRLLEPLMKLFMAVMMLVVRFVPHGSQRTSPASSTVCWYPRYQKGRCCLSSASSAVLAAA